MAIVITTFVENEIVSTTKISDNPVSFYQKIVNAAKNNPTLVEITNMENYPVEGMRFENGEFIETEDLKFISNPNLANSHTFAFIVDNVYVATQGFDVPEMLGNVAAYQSNPTFEVTEGVEDIYID